MLRRLRRFLRRTKKDTTDEVTIADLEDTVVVLLFLKRVFDKIDVSTLIKLLYILGDMKKK